MICCARTPAKQVFKIHLVRIRLYQAISLRIFFIYTEHHFCMHVCPKQRVKKFHIVLF